ncbi:trypsin-like peptidase domain-containing protein [Bdellovibrio sp. HCB337]|uniref:trypsin-like peptidase domain-containing protein n=1 Tax=Bdellovibrio sp. HCB337 TaxID=3394358 RepID=UPI0039A60A9A
MPIFAILFLVLLSACAPEGEHTTTTQDQKVTDKLIYGDDDRRDLYDVANALNKKLADSTVALIESSNLKAQGASVFGLPAETYGSQQLLCSTEVFYDQPAAAFCSGSLVGPNLILTAGHCIKDASDCADVRFVFGYAVKQLGKYPVTVAQGEVYSCKRIVSRKLEGAGSDYALIETDRPVVGHEVLKLQRSRVAAVGDALTVIGHPSGLPTKVASGGKVRKVQPAHLVTNLDTYGGNSGSGVFNSETGEIVGILVRGDTDFISKGSCYVSNRCPADGCRGEDVTRIDQVAALIPEVPTSPTPTPAPSPSPSPSPVPVERVYSVKASAAIPDNNAKGAESSIQVSEAVAGRKVLIGVDIEHTYVGDLTLTLISPSGKSYILRKNKGGRARDIKGVFGEALTSETSLAPLSSSAAGTWRLKVVDSLSRDVGTLREWKVILK